MTEDGTTSEVKLQVCPVTKPLASLSRMARVRNKVVFDSVDAPEGSYIHNKATGHRTYLRQESGVYLLDLWAMPNLAQEATFHRQEF
eukprot:12406881-Karenia_brevis.AAC.1